MAVFNGSDTSFATPRYGSKKDIAKTVNYICTRLIYYYVTANLVILCEMLSYMLEKVNLHHLKDRCFVR